MCGERKYYFCRLKEIIFDSNPELDRKKDQRRIIKIVTEILDSMELQFVRGTGRDRKLLWHLLGCHLLADPDSLTIYDIPVTSDYADNIDWFALWATTCVDICRKLCNKPQTKLDQRLFEAFYNDVDSKKKTIVRQLVESNTEPIMEMKSKR